jgi:hypothetical protein
MAFSLVKTYQCFRGIYYPHVYDSRTYCMQEWCRYETGGPGMESGVKLYKTLAINGAVLYG